VRSVFSAISKFSVRKEPQRRNEVEYSNGSKNTFDYWRFRSAATTKNSKKRKKEVTVSRLTEENLALIRSNRAIAVVRKVEARVVTFKSHDLKRRHWN
jgi:hypothetical protein